jgi:hypothetical protein
LKIRKSKKVKEKEKGGDCGCDDDAIGEGATLVSQCNPQ